MNKFNSILIYLFAGITSILYVIGNKIDFGEGMPAFRSFSLFDIIIFALGFAAVYFIVSESVNFISKKGFTANTGTTLSGRHKVIIFLIMIISWTPYLLVYYPGIMITDTMFSVDQILGNIPYINHHPVLFTFVLGIFVKLGILLGDINKGICFFTVFQMAIMSSIGVYLVDFLSKKGISKKLLYAVVGFFAINPVIAIHSVSIVKDVLFSGILIILVMQLFDLAESKGELLRDKGFIIKFVTLSFLLAFARNNGFYIVIATFAFVIIFYRSYFKRIIPVFSATVIIIAIIQGPIYTGLGIEKANFAESVGVPIQQIAYTLANEGKVTDGEKEFINKILPIEEIIKSYHPLCADPIKGREDFNDSFLNENKLEFLKLWLGIMKSNPGSYAKSWLILTSGYYHIGINYPDRIVLAPAETRGEAVNEEVQVKTDEVKMKYFSNYKLSDFGIKSTNVIKNTTGIDLRPIINKMIGVVVWLPLLGMIFNIGFMVWFVFFYALAMYKIRGKDFILPAVPLVFLWVTIMIATPIFSEFRYVYGIHLALPFLVISMFFGNGDNINTKEIKNV